MKSFTDLFKLLKSCLPIERTEKTIQERVNIVLWPTKNPNLYHKFKWNIQYLHQEEYEEVEYVL